MKKGFVTLLMVLVAAGARAGGWSDEWLDQMTQTDAGRFEGQKRGYYTAGGVNARWRMNQDYLFSVSKPRLNAGCGGIDAFLGGFSFLDPEYLVEKMQRVVQAAPAVAFDMAMKTMCKECSETMKSMEQIIDKMNSIQLDECAMSKRLVASVKSDDQDIVGDMWNEISANQSLDEGNSKLYHEHSESVQANDGKAPEDLRKAIAGCPAEFKAIFGGGSVIGNAADQVGLAPFAAVIRGYVGDIEVAYSEGTNTYEVRRVEKCRQNTALEPNTFLQGEAFARQALADGGACYRDSGTKLTQYVSDRLHAIADKIKQRNAQFTTEEAAFIDNAPLPVYVQLRDAVIQQRVNSTIYTLEEPIAVAYAQRIMEDLYRTTEYMLGKAREASNPLGPASGASGDCNPKVLAHATAKVEKLRKEVWDIRLGVKGAYRAALAEREQYLSAAQREYEIGRRGRKNLQLKIR